MSRGVETPSESSLNLQPSSRTKQVGSVPAFGDGKGAATITSTPLQEPKPNPISKPVMERHAWVQGVTPTKVDPFTTLSSIAQPHNPRAVTIQTAPADPSDTRDLMGSDTALFAPPQTTIDPRVVPRDDITIQITVKQDNGTLAFPTNRKNATDHKTHHMTHHHHVNYTKTITDMITKTRNVTDTVTTFPQLQTQNLSHPYALTGSAASIDSNYTKLTYHNAEAARPTQNAVFSSPFFPAVPGVSHAPASSPAMHAFEAPGIGSLLLFNIIVIVLGLYLLASGKVDEPVRKQEAPLTADEQKVALANLGACAGSVEDAETMLAKLQDKAFKLHERNARVILAELKRKPFSEDDVQAIQKNVNERFATHKRQEALDKDWHESEKLAAEASAQMWEEEKLKRRTTVSQSGPSQRRNAVSEPSSKEVDATMFPSLDHLDDKI